MDAHRVRRLRWRATAASPAEAFALRSLVREQGDACQDAIDRAFDRFAPAGEVWRLPQLAFTIRVAGLHELEASGLSERVEAALQTVLAEAAQARPGAPTRPSAAVPGPAADARPPAAETLSPASSLRPAAAEQRQALLHYLSTGLLPWTLAGISPEQAQRELRDAAVQATESLLAGVEAPDALLPQGGIDARIGALLRWLPLLAAPLRRRWLAATRAPWALDAATAEAWRRWVDADAPGRIEWQALWLAGPLGAAALRARIEAQRAPATEEPPFLPGLLRVLAPAAHTAGAGGRAAPAGATGPQDFASMAAPLPASAASTTPESLLVPLAGLVLLHPWLPRLLAGCGALDETGREIAHLPRACALLHALACGNAEPAEHQLPFVKLLLGRPPDEPLTAALPGLTANDQEEIAALLAAVREHWSALRGTAIEGLRLSFLQRRGLLEHTDAAWQLRMQGEAFDMLLGLLPWSIGLVRLPWMREPLVVEWLTP